MKCKLLLLLSTLLVSLTFGAVSEKARTLNKQGFRLYKSGDYDKAAALFEHSVREAPNWDVPHYNAACMYSLMYKSAIEGEKYQEEVFCEEGFLDRAINHMKRALEIKPARKAKLFTDTDLEGITANFTYNTTILKYNPRNHKDLKKIITNVLWWGANPGTSGPISFIDFQKDGTYKGWKIEAGEDGYRKIKTGGHWEIRGDRIILDGKTVRFLNTKGNLTDDTKREVGFFIPDMCGA